MGPNTFARHVCHTRWLSRLSMNSLNSIAEFKSLVTSKDKKRLHVCVSYLSELDKDLRF